MFHKVCMYPLISNFDLGSQKARALKHTHTHTHMQKKRKRFGQYIALRFEKMKILKAKTSLFYK